jgi:hypothetical protein
MRATRGDHLVAEAEAAGGGRKTARPSDSSADSPGGVSSGRMRLLRRFDAGLRRRCPFEIRLARCARQTAALGGKAHGGNRSGVQVAIHCGPERRCARSNESCHVSVDVHRGARKFDERANVHMRKCNTRPRRRARLQGRPAKRLRPRRNALQGLSDFALGPPAPSPRKIRRPPSGRSAAHQDSDSASLSASPARPEAGFIGAW